MASRLETMAELADFIKAGDVQMDTEWFWDRLGVSTEALAAFAAFCEEVRKEKPAEIKNDASFNLMLMEFGARIALRNQADDQLALGRDNAD